MDANQLYLIAADSILFAHALFVGFVVIGLVLIYAGKLMHWSWIRNRWFRILHLVAIAGIVLQSWLGLACPLTLWEMGLRGRAGDAVYAGSFVAHWVESLLYYQAPEWLFVLVYTLFGTLVAASWYWVPPKK